MLAPLLLAGLSAALPSVPGPQLPVRDVVVIVLDDVGFDDVAEDVPTPGLDRLAASGTWVRRFYVSPVCSPTRATLLAALPPDVTGVGKPLNPDSSDDYHGLSEARPTLPDFLAARGLETCLVGKWHASLGNPLDHGFGTWTAGMTGNFSPSVIDGRPTDHYSWDRWEGRAVARETTWSATAQTDAAIAWWTRRTPARRALFVAYNVAHVPLNPPPGELVQGTIPPATAQRGVFLRTISALDHELQRLLEVIDLERTLVVLFSDNGTPGAVLAHDVPAGHGKATTFEHGIRTFAVFAGGPVPAGARRDAHLAHVIDLPATLTDYLGLGGLDFANESTSLRGLIQDGDRPHDLVVCQYFGPNGSFGDHAFERAAAVSRRFKLTRNGALYRLYDLRLDPLELSPQPFSKGGPEIVTRLRAALQSLR